jgi:multicomponent Na+:H+ antiporter subunit D
VIEWTFWLPLMVVLSSFVPGVFIFFLREDQSYLRTALNLLGAVFKLVFIGVMLWGVYFEVDYETRMTIVGEFDLVLHSSALAMLFVTLSGVLWLVTTIYAVGYLEESAHRSRFFGFFSLCVSASTGIALAGNLLSFIIFYELLTLTTYPLVVHRETKRARRAGVIYLAYTLGGGALLLLGIVWLHSLAAGPIPFVTGGALTQMGFVPSATLAVIFFVLIAGLGAKASLVPLHGWLPIAMIAPAPVSALLHAVAVVKAGAFGIVRVIYDVYGIALVDAMGVDLPLMIIATVTILYGSIMALFQDGLKRMLAYSTVSQLSYIVLGIAVVGPLATIGGLVHLVHQGIMKITLFFCAGSIDHTLGLKRISQLGGIGARMPLTMVAFTVAALGMIGVPPLAGFVSKWYLGIGAAEAAKSWVIWVLVASTILNAAYFLPVVYKAWFGAKSAEWTEHWPSGRLETRASLLVPTLITATLVILAGVFANTTFSPLEWVMIITERLH